jgi:VWFA-related protein
MKRLAWCFCVAVFYCSFAQAQDQTVVVDVNLVQIGATVEDQYGRPITNLAAADFQLLESGTPREIRHFSDNNQRLALGFVLDRSISVDADKKQMDTMLSDLVGAVGPGDEAFLVTFAGDNTVAVGMTADKGQILKAAHKAHSTYGTRFYDAIITSLEYLSHSHAERKALIVLSDGADHSSSSTVQDTLAAALKYGTEIYLIGYRGNDPLVWAEASRNEIHGAFATLAAGSGGQCFFPESMRDSRGISSHILQRLRHQYRFGFYSESGGEVEIRLSGEYDKRFSVRVVGDGDQQTAQVLR